MAQQPGGPAPGAGFDAGFARDHDRL